MTTFLTRGGLTLGLFAGLVLLAGGCNKPEGTGSGPVAENKDKPKDADKDKPKEPGKDKLEEKDDHKGWWCKEHGIPEHECSMCDDAYAQKCKDKKDWCEKHDRADSQCFICHPEHREKFAAKYRAKYGKEPPPTRDPKPEPK